MNRNADSNVMICVLGLRLKTVAKNRANHNVEHSKLENKNISFCGMFNVMICFVFCNSLKPEPQNANRNVGIRVTIYMFFCNSPKPEP